jgi:hypothetical protein
MPAQSSFLDVNGIPPKFFIAHRIRQKRQNIHEKAAAKDFPLQRLT